MRTFKLTKLVRDNIVGFHKDEGGKVDYEILDDKAYLQALCRKLAEEVSEINSTAESELLQELADLQEVIDCILPVISKTRTDLTDAQVKKNQKSGSFKKRYFINTVSLPDNEKWTEYYAKHPKRFPEIKGGKE